jgi:hypothetical protein
MLIEDLFFELNISGVYNNIISAYITEPALFLI